jgi:hypothetical protein
LRDKPRWECNFCDWRWAFQEDWAVARKGETQHFYSVLGEAGIEGTHEKAETKTKVALMPEIWDDKVLTKKIKDLQGRVKKPERILKKREKKRLKRKKN